MNKPNKYFKYFKYKKIFYSKKKENLSKLEFLYNYVKNIFEKSIFYKKYNYKFPKFYLIESDEYATLTLNKTYIIINFRNYAINDLIYQLIHEISHLFCQSCSDHDVDWHKVLYNLCMIYFTDNLLHNF